MRGTRIHRARGSRAARSRCRRGRHRPPCPGTIRGSSRARAAARWSCCRPGTSPRPGRSLPGGLVPAARRTCAPGSPDQRPSATERCSAGTAPEARRRVAEDLDGRIRQVEFLAQEVRVARAVQVRSRSSGDFPASTSRFDNKKVLSFVRASPEAETHRHAGELPRFEAVERHAAQQHVAAIARLVEEQRRLSGHANRAS